MTTSRLVANRSTRPGAGQRAVGPPAVQVAGEQQGEYVVVLRAGPDQVAQPETDELGLPPTEDLDGRLVQVDDHQVGVVGLGLDEDHADQ